jgi:MYXO-CTERM domain-containing protein
MKWRTRMGASALMMSATVAGITMASQPAEAFCGFYVAGADAKLFNNATLVVMMRDGTKTVLSMQNNYQGPPENFAMVVPVPVVLKEENVKTLEASIFDRVDRLAAPRLVEYWEKDPCKPDPPRRRFASASKESATDSAAPGGGGVKIEAQFSVAEYDIVVLSASDSTGLDRWLKANKYSIPSGAEPLLRPYVEEGSKFFVAKVDVSKVKFENGQAMLSPLRMHYDSDKFSLPVRLGLINASSKQDLIVHVLAKTRFEVANYPNVTIPTNIDLDEQAKGQFGSFYAKLFDRTLEKNPKAVVTEYAWDAGTCDPCPSPALTAQEISTLGGDVIPDANPWGMVLTRLHARYDKSDLGEDLVFKKASGIAGGREFLRDGDKLETGSSDAPRNNFQGRYAIRHPWTGPIECEDPKRGRWGGPPGGGDVSPTPALKLAFASREGTQLASFVEHDVPEIALKAKEATVDHPGSIPKAKTAGGDAKPAPTGAASAPPPAAAPPSGGCGGCTVTGEPRGSTLPAWLAVLGLGLIGSRRGSRRT